MEDRGKRPWSGIIFLLALIGCNQLPLAHCADTFDEPAKGDNDASYSEPVGNTNLGFDDVVRRHDGYVKGETPTIPKTSFACSAQPYSPGLYADMETNCQVYHVCFEGRQESFLCGPGTTFNQKILACDFWYNFNCQDSAQFYSANADIGKIPESVYRPSGSHQAERPSYPSYPQPDHRPVSGDGYQPPPPVSRQPRPPPPPPPQPRPQPQPPRVYPQPPRQPQPPRVPPQPQPPRIPQPSAQPPRVEQPSIPVLTIEDQKDAGYEPQRPVVQVHTHYPTTPRPVFPPVVSPPRVTRPPVQHPVVVRRPAEPTPPRTPSRPSIQQEQIEIKGSDYRPPSPDTPRIPQPSQPVDSGFPAYPSRPVSQQPVRHVGGRRPQPPPELQQEHVDVSYVPPPAPRQPPRPSYQPPPPPPPPRRPPSRPSYVPPPAPPRPSVQQEVVDVKPDFVRPPAPSQVSGEYVPPPPPAPPRRPAPRPVSPPVAPSVITQHQRRPGPPPVRPQPVSTRPRQPQRPRPVFPPSSDHPNANVKGGPRYRQPPPSQLPSFEPTRITHRPSGSAAQPGYQRPPSVATGVYEPPKTTGVKRPAQTVSTGYKRPQPPAQATGDGYKPPRTPSVAVSLPPRPPPVPEHPDAAIKGTGYVQPPAPRQPTRVISPATAVTSVKRPQTGGSVHTGARPLPPAPPSIGNEIHRQRRPPAPGRVKLPSQPKEQKLPGQTEIVPQRQVFPAPRPRPSDHPNANVKGGSRYRQPRPQPARTSQPSYPAPPPVPPSAPSTSIERKTSPGRQTQSLGGARGHPPQRPQIDDYLGPEVISQEKYEPQRRPLPPPIATPQEQTFSRGVKRPAPSQQTVRVKQAQPDYDSGSSYKRGPEYYPKPEFQQAIHPVATPSRPSHTTKTASASQTRVLSQGGPGSSSSVVHGGRYPQGSGTGSGSSQADYPYAQIPGHQPPHQRQVFPHRDNPDHPNASIKGTNAYRPPPPANYEAAASEVQEQKAENPNKQSSSESSSKLGDTGTE